METSADTKNKRSLIILLVPVALLLIPLIAMQFSDEVNWSSFDFLVGGVLLFGTGLLVELALRKVKKTTHRLLAVAVILLVLLLTWAELAVGIFGTPFAGS